MLAGCAALTQYGQAYARAENAWTHRDYDRTVRECVKTLRYRPDFIQAEDLLEKAFPLAVEEYHRDIERKQQSSDAFPYDDIVKMYEELIYLTDIVESLKLPQTEVLFFKADVQDYHQLLLNAKNLAAEDHYLKGLDYRKAGTREAYRSAAQEFKKCLRYAADYHDASELYEDSRRKGLTRVAVMPFENRSGQIEYGDVGDALSSKVVALLLADDELLETIEIVSRDNMNLILEEQELSQSCLVDDDHSIELGNILGVHQIITGSITHINSSEPQTVRNKKDYEKTIIVAQEKYEDKDGKEHIRNVYDKVKARVTFHETRSEVSLLASYQILDVNTSRIIHSNSISCSAGYHHEWATYTGNKKALSWSAKSLVQAEAEVAPSNGELVLKALDDLARQSVNGISDNIH